MSAFVLAIDQGTTNTKALALDPDGRIVARHSVPTPISYPRPGWVEQSGDEIWRATTAAIDGCLSALPEPATIAAIGVSNQRETVLLWRRSTGETIGPCVTWQCRRSSDRIDALRTPAIEAAVQAKTGLGLDPLFPAAKIGWLLEAYPEARSLSDRGDLCAGTIDSWLLYNLTGGAVHATDASNASRTQLFDIHQQEWGDELCAAVRRAEVDPSARRGFKRQVRRGEGCSSIDRRRCCPCDDGGLACRAVRPRHTFSRSGQSDLRNRLFADDADRDADPIPVRPLHDCRLAAFEDGFVCARGQHFGIGSGGRMDGRTYGPARCRGADGVGDEGQG